MEYIKKQCSAYLDAEVRAAERADSERRAQQAAQARQLQAAQEARARQVQAAQEAAAEARRTVELRRFQAITNIRVILKDFKRSSYCDDADPEQRAGRQSSPFEFPPPITLKCKADDPVSLNVEVTNQSKDALSAIAIGLAFVPAKGDPCPQSYAETTTLWMRLSPGETRVSKIDYMDAGFSKYPVCIKVIDVKFASN
jgi:hypothetical protein